MEEGEQQTTIFQPWLHGLSEPQAPYGGRALAAKKDKTDFFLKKRMVGTVHGSSRLGEAMGDTATGRPVAGAASHPTGASAATDVCVHIATM